MNKEEIQFELEEKIQERTFDINSLLNEEGYEIYLLNALPPYSTSLHKYIRQKANSDLPQSQFKTTDIKDSDFLEARGILGYSNKLFEITYDFPTKENTLVEKLTDGRRIIYFTDGGELVDNLDYSEFKNIKELVFWHTHPLPKPVSVRDFESMIYLNTASAILSEIIAEEKNKRVEIESKSVLYIPYLDNFYWFQIKLDL